MKTMSKKYSFEDWSKLPKTKKKFKQLAKDLAEFNQLKLEL